jgi:uncharacterized membrane protein YkoI
MGGGAISLTPHGLWALILLTWLACPAGDGSQITREQAIAIAQKEVSFQPDSVEALLSTSNERPVWRVTFRGRLPGQPPGLFETTIVEVDANSGAVVSVGRT